jgi:diguanylate cyclase (GGDEF)-like protein
MALRETDIVTGLYTPGFLIAFGARELSFARESGYPLSLISVNVNFLNTGRPGSPDTLSSDEARRLGDRIRREAGEGSLVAHMGEREIAVLLPGVGQARADQIAEKIRKSVVRRNLNMTGPIIGSASVGVSTLSPETKDFAEMLRSARTALNASRNGGPAMVYPQLQMT